MNNSFIQNPNNPNGGFVIRNLEQPNNAVHLVCGRCKMCKSIALISFPVGVFTIPYLLWLDSVFI